MTYALPAKLAGLAAAALLGAAVQAQDYPAKPIRIISGPGPDVMVRIVGQRITEVLGQQVIAESLPAAGGKAAAEALAKSPPDGYTLLNATTSFHIATAVGIIPLDIARDVVPVSLTNYTPFLLAVPAAVPAQSVQEFIALARAKPGVLNYASGGNGTLPHLGAELFKSMTGTDIVHVPFKTAAQAGTALLGNQVQMMITAFSVAGPQAAAGKVRLLAMTTPERSRLAPDIPTLSEAGVPGYEVMGWNGLVAPAGTPPAIVNRVYDVVRRGVRTPEIARQFANVGFEAPDPFPTPQQFGEFLKGEAAKWTKLVKDTGTKAD